MFFVTLWCISPVCSFRLFPKKAEEKAEVGPKTSKKKEEQNRFRSSLTSVVNLSVNLVSDPRR